MIIKEIAQFIAKLETTFKLPVVESEVLKNRYKNLQRIHKELIKLEEKHSKLSTQNSTNSSIVQALTQRRDFLANLYQSLLNGSKLRKNASIIFSTTETKIKNEIMQLEEALKSRENSVNRLKFQIKDEEKKLKNAKETAENKKEITYKNETDLSELEKQKETLKAIFEADQKVVKKMEEYFFKMTTNLFELQREIDKRTLHLTAHQKASPLKNGSNNGSKFEEEEENERNKGWHAISHIMEDMGKEQAKYLKIGGINENNFEEYKYWELNEDEKQWLKRELKIQKQNFEENEIELKKIVNETKNITKEFLNVVEETETLLKKYAAVECKNMTTDLRNARLQILATATKYEPETPMYKKYHETIQESVMATEKPEFQELYSRKIENAKFAASEAEKCEHEIRKCKTNIRKELYWMDKRPEDQQKISDIKKSIEEMDANLLKEFLRALVIGGTLSTSESSPEILPDLIATQLTDFLKQMTENRNRMFEIHLKKCLQIYLKDIKKISDEAADLENDVRSLEKALLEAKKEKAKEEEFCDRLKERIKIVEEKTAKRKEEVKEEDVKNEKQWIKEVKELEEKLFEANEKRENARIEKLNCQEKIRAAQIEENNLRHRFNVFQSLKKSEKEGRKQFESSEKLFESEKYKNDKIKAETEMMEKILEEALKQESNLEKAIENGFIQGSVSEEQQSLEAEKHELEAELEYLLSMEQKLKGKK